MSRRTGRWRTVFVVAILAILGTFGLSVAGAQVAIRVLEVTDVASCEQLAAQVGAPSAWAGIRIGSPRNGSFGNSYATVAVSGLSGSQFDWSADLGMSALLITYQNPDASVTKQEAYIYSLPAADGIAVGNVEVLVGGAISQITFCHDPGTPVAGLSTDTSVASTTTTPPSSTTAADSTTTSATTTTVDLTTTTHVDGADSEVAVTGADSGVLVALGLVLVLLGIGFTSLFEVGRRNSYARGGPPRH
ncbi:MAG: hypothetical protein ACC652_02155 [Acidimicrobiales bacterium]